MKTEVDVIEDVEEYQTVPGIITVIMRIIGDPSIVIQSFFYFSVFKYVLSNKIFFDEGSRY